MNNAIKIVTDALSSLTDLAIHLLVAGVIIGILFGDMFGVIGNIAAVMASVGIYLNVINLFSFFMSIIGMSSDE